MKAITTSGKILTGKIAEILVRNGRATVLSDTEKKRGRPKKEDIEKIPGNKEFIKKVPKTKTINK